jgi:hypothetical protein
VAQFRIVNPVRPPATYLYTLQRSLIPSAVPTCSSKSRRMCCFHVRVQSLDRDFAQIVGTALAKRVQRKWGYRLREESGPDGLLTRGTMRRDQSPGTETLTGRCWHQGSLAGSVEDSRKMRRSLSFLIALGLVGLGPLPLAACALIYSQPGECATTRTETHCDQMGMVTH